MTRLNRSNHPWICFTTAVCLLFANSCLSLTPFPYGFARFDTELEGCWDDDVSCGPIALTTSSFVYGSTVVTEIWPNSNGFVTFEEYVDFDFESFPSRMDMIAPWFSDISIEFDGNLLYRQSTRTRDLNAINAEIRSLTPFTSFEASWVMVLTWEDVPQYETDADWSTFQVVFTTDSTGLYSFVLFYLVDINSLQARSGLSFENGQFFEVPGYATDLRESSNVGVYGKYILPTNELLMRWVGCEKHLSAGDYEGIGFTYDCRSCLPGESYTSKSDICYTCLDGSNRLGLLINECQYCPPGEDGFIINGLCSFCEPGSYITNDGNGCELCPENFFSDEERASECTPCPSGFYSLEGSSICDPCGPGHISDSDFQHCSECPPGYFSSGHGESFCSSCGSGKFADDWAFTSCDSCGDGTSAEVAASECSDCQVGKYSVSGFSSCTTCEVGSFTELEASSSCIACEIGEYAANSSTPCASCDAGRYSVTGSSSCPTCPGGSYNTEPRQTSCIQCSSGEYTPSPSSPCQKCVAGRFAVTAGSSCESCPAGKVNTISGATACDLCSPGYYSYNTTFCEKCSTGKYSTIPKDSCDTCQPGKWTGDLGATACIACTRGKYSQSAIMPCEECPAGTFSSEESSPVCEKCPAGRFSTEIGAVNESSCFICEPGKFSFEGQTTCTSCPPGRFTALEGKGLCAGCPAGRFGEDVGSTTSATCKICPKGKYSWYSSSTCIDCPAGSFSNIRGAASNESCLQCPGSEGLICEAGSPVPWVREGFFRDFVQPDNIRRCIPPEACKSSGYGLTECTEGYEGELCGDCTKLEYYRFNGKCRKCGSNTVKWMFMFIGFIVFLIFLLYFSVPSDTFGSDFRVSLFWIQVIALYPRLTDSWSGALLSFFGVISLANLNFDFFSIECSVASDYWTIWSVKMMMPFVLASFLILCYFIKLIISYAFKNSSVVQKYTSMLTIDRFIYCYILILNIFFTYLISTLLEPFQCYPQDDGSSTMVHDPSKKCFTPEWSSQVKSWIPLFMLIYFLGFPISLSYLFWKYSGNIQTDWFLNKFGVLTIPYNKQYFWYEVIIVVKKISFVILPEFLGYYITQRAKVAIVIMFMFIFMVFEQMLKPFANSQYQTLSLLWSTVALFVLSISFIFKSDATYGSEIQVLSVFCIVYFVVTICYTLKCMFLKFKQTKVFSVLMREKQRKDAAEYYGTRIVSNSTA